MDDVECRCINMRGRPSLFSDEQRADIVQRYEGGDSIATLAASLGCSRVTVLRIIKKAGVHEGVRRERNHRAVLTEADVAAIRAAYVPGIVTLRDLADQYGVHLSSIHAVIQHRTWGEES